MATTSQWEVVGKSSSKKTKNASKQMSKSEKKAYVEEQQRRAQLAPSRGPLHESTNMFEAFIEKEDGEPPLHIGSKPNGTSSNMNGGVVQAKKTQNKPKKTNEKRKVNMTLDEGLSKISVQDIETLLTKDQTTFPDNPSVWLKDLASYLNIKLDAVPENDPLFEKHPADYPLCRVPKSLQKVLKKTLDSTNFGVLELFFEHCVQSMLTDMGKGASTYGYRIFIQLMAHDNPKILQANLSRYLELLKTNQNRQLRCLSVMWAVGQPGVKNLTCGLRIWMDVMFPVLGIRALSNYAVTYLENIFKLHADVKPAYGTITFRDFFPLFDVIFSGNASLPGPLQKRLVALYPKVKAVAFTNKQDSLLRNFFPSFLARATPHCQGAMKTELQSCLLACLQYDKQCYSIWRQMYTRHFVQAGFLLQCLVDNWGRTNVVKLDTKLLMDTVRTFNVTNEDLAAQKKNNMDGYSQCNAACKILLSKNGGGHFPWFLIFMTSLTLIASMIVYDVYTHGHFYGCKTHVFLTDTGTITFCRQVWSRIRMYSLIAYNWLELNVPLYYSKAVDIIGPYLVLAWEKTLQFYNWLVLITGPLRAWMYVKGGELGVWLQARGPMWYKDIMYYVTPVWQSFLLYATPVWLGILHYARIFWRQVTVYFAIIGKWMVENIFVGRFSLENIQRELVDALLLLRTYINHVIQWCAAVFFNAKSA